MAALTPSRQVFAQTQPTPDEKKVPVNATQPVGQSPGSNNTPGQQGGSSQPAIPAPTTTPAAEDNGITIGQPKQFDERTLTLMLQSLEDKLARTQFPDPSGLYSSVGRFGGATATSSSMALSLRGPAMPSVATTMGSTTKEGSTTNSTQETNQTTTQTTNVGGTGPTSTVGGTTGDKNSSTSGTTGENSSTMQQQINQPGLAPPVPGLPGQTSLYSYQPQFGISSQDLLSEQTSLFYQIVNLRMLLDRSLTDRIGIEPITDSGGTGDRLTERDQIVLGFQISIDAAHKDAVAEAEITISGTGTSLVSLLPRDKTYNVASVTKDSKAIDMGAVVQFVGVGASVGKTQESLYLVKDTDTVALERNAPASTAKFAWQFRPVLGRRTVEPGMRQVYALISIPSGSERWNGKVTATTRWRRYDRKNKSVGGLIDAAKESSPYKDQALNISDVSVTDFMLGPSISDLRPIDAGGGQVLVIVEGKGFTPDTALVLGNMVLNRPENGLTVVNERRLRVVAPAQLLAQSPTLVGRYGTTDFIRPLKCASSGCVPVEFPYTGLRLETPIIRARDQQSSEVTVRIVSDDPKTDPKYRVDEHKPVVVIGDKVFGLSDAPFISVVSSVVDGKRAAELTFVAPTQFLANARSLTVKEFMWNKGQLSINFVPDDKFTATGLTTLGSNGDKMQLAILGGGFTDDVKVRVGDVTFAVKCDDEVGCLPNTLNRHVKSGPSTLITLSPTQGQIKDVKHLIVMQGEAQPVALALASPPPSVPTAKIFSPSEPLSVGRGNSEPIKFEGANFGSIQQVVFEGKPLTIKPDEKDNTVLWVYVETFLTGEPGRKRIVFRMKDGKEVPFTLFVP
jgi:hypothetical protein